MLALVSCCATALVPLRLPLGATSVGRVPAGPLCRTARLQCLAGPRLTCVEARAGSPVACEGEFSEEDLKDELFDLIDTIPERGIGASEDDKADILEIIAELEETEGGAACADYSNSPLFSGTFELLYCSSKTFHTNKGLMAYSRDVAAVSTPELSMKLTRDAGNRLVVFEEPLEFDEKSIAGVLGGLTKTDVLRAECSWRATASGVFAIDAQRISAGGRSWVPADRQAKGIRAVSACTPVYLDDELLVLRGQIPDVVFVWERSDEAPAERVGNYVDPIPGK